MPGKIRLKTVKSAGLCALAVMMLSVCVEPVDVGSFMENPKVIDQINNNKVTVNISSDSDPGLIAGSGRISGLTPGKYYRLEEYDEGLVFKGNLFVKPNGDYWGDLSQIGRLTGSQIVNLKNNYTYKVKSAQLFTSGSYDYFTFSDTAVTKATVANGAVTIKGQNTNIYYFDFATVINAGKDYEVMKNPISGNNPSWGNSRTSAYYNYTYNIGSIVDNNYIRYGGTAKSIGIYQYRGTGVSTNNGITLDNRSILALADGTTQSDYVFAEYENGKVTNFTVLSVERIELINVTVSVAAGFSEGYTPNITPSVSSNFNQTDTSFNITLILDNPLTYNDIKWYKDTNTTVPLGSGASIPLNNNLSSNAGWWQAGDHYIYLILVNTTGALPPQSGVIKITCDP